MSIEISVLEKAGILEVVYSEDAVSSRDLAEQRELVTNAIEKSALNKVLIDASALETFPSPFTVYDHNKEVAARELFLRVRFAIVVARQGEDERCLENTGRNRGVYIKCFTSREEAVDWLA